jgi:cyclopropane fatty-acyl-phospholipid synthase-like methyltransferase
MIELLWNAPVGEAKMSKMLEALGLRDHDRVLDVGCGCGEVLVRTCERYGIQGKGIDTSTEHLAEARRRAGERVTDSKLQFIEANAEVFEIESESLELVMCLGATHAFGLGSDAVKRAICRVTEMIVPGGQILVADGYMRQSKPLEYREFLGDDIPDDLTHASIVSMGKEQGLVPMAAWTSSEEEWDDFEWTYQRIVEQQAAENSNDPSILEKRDRRREWMDAYLKLGRATLGYGTYLFRKVIVHCGDKL